LAAAHLSFPSGNIHNWLIMNSIVFTFGSLSAELYRCANRIYNERFYFYDHFPPAYRTCLVAAKSKNAIGQFDQLRKKLTRWIDRSNPIFSPTQNSVENSSAFTDFYSWRQALRILKQVTRERDVHIGNLNQIIRDKDLHLQNLQNSNAWRALRRYYELRDRALPNGSKRRTVLVNLWRLATRGLLLPLKRRWHDL
jgi:hypothetical protein